MGRLHAHTFFDAHYPPSAAGLVAAEHELVRLIAMQAAYAAQPGITPRWQAYIDQKHDAVVNQQRIVTALTAAL
jgi:hypothetical protein